MKSEILAYILLGLTVFVIFTVPGFVYDKPDLSEPDQVQIASTTQQTTRSTQSTRQPDPGSSPSGLIAQSPSIIQGLIIIIGIIAIILLINQFRYYKQSGFRISKPKEKEEIEKVLQLNQARNTAITILNDALITGNYTSGFIEAYHELDKNLEYFRNLARPKHFTPREYSFFVREPIFQPSVYRFVQIFYKIRYGNEEATEADIRVFLDAINHLFTNELSEKIKEELLVTFNEEMASYQVFHIPREFDLTKPKGGKL